MKTLTCDLQSHNGEIELYIIGDTHIGSMQFNEPLLLNLIDHILEKPNRYVILNGDIVDCTFKDSKGNVYENEMQPDVALSYASLKLSPLAKANRILCTCGGNHDDDRSARLIGISLAQQLAVLLGVPNLYSPDSCMIFARCKNMIKTHQKQNVMYHIFVNHGNNGGGATIGSKANALEKMAYVVPNADVYIHNHTHTPMTFKDEICCIDDIRCRLNWKTRLYVNGNAFLNYFNGYGEKKLFKPQSQAIPTIKLKAKREIIDSSERLVKIATCEL